MFSNCCSTICRASAISSERLADSPGAKTSNSWSTSSTAASRSPVPGKGLEDLCDQSIDLRSWHEKSRRCNGKGPECAHSSDREAHPNVPHAVFETRGWSGSPCGRGGTRRVPMAIALPRAARVRRERLARAAPEPPVALPREIGGLWFFGQQGCSYCETCGAVVRMASVSSPITVSPEARR